MFLVGAAGLLLSSQPLLPHQGIQVMPELEDLSFFRQHNGNTCKYFMDKVRVVAVSSFMQKKKYGLVVGFPLPPPQISLSFSLVA